MLISYTVDRPSIEPDRLDWIGRIHRMVFFLIDLDHCRQNVEPVAIGRAAGRAHSLSTLANAAS